MSNQQMHHVRDILARMLARYMTIRPYGIEVEKGRKHLPCLKCRILNHGAARTLYRGRRPLCRSLDAVKALREPDKLCQQCPDRNECTPQVRIDLLFESRPYRLLLAYTSAKNFLLYSGDLSVKKLELCTVRTKICVVNRGSWGELRFSVCLS